MILLDELVKRGLIEEKQVLDIYKIAEEKYEGSVDEALLSLNINEDEILKIKSTLFSIPSREVDPGSVDSSVLELIPVDTAKIYHFAPIGLKDNVLEVGIVDPENIQAIDVLTFMTSKIDKPFKLFLIKTSIFNKLIEKYNGLGSEVGEALSELDSDLASEIENVSKKSIKELSVKSDADKVHEEKIVEDAPIIKIVAVILRHATEGKASDIHIENGGDKVKVRFRVDGILYTSLVLPVNVYNGVVARIKILSKLRLDEKRKPQDGGFSAKIDGRKIDFRVSTMPSYFGEKIVMRILDSQKGISPLDQLYLSEDNLALVRESLKRPYGLILMTGPTGSGKTTTLYSMINELDKEKSNIVSLEDPVEYQINGVNQSQVMPEIGYTFASGLRSILRQDPDIILVGEIRDKETAELAIQAALTGHLVLSTLHTNNSIGAIPRLIDMGIDPYLIAPTLILCMAQRLARKIHPSSKHEIPVDEATREMIDKQFADLPDEYKSKINISKNTIYEAVSSSESSSGMSGRVPVFEMFAIDKEMQNIILKKPVEQEIYKLARSRGMITIREDAIVKSMKGDIPFQEIYNF